MSRILVVRRLSHAMPPLPSGPRRGRLRVFGAVAIAGLLAAGCSADISRFDGQGYGLTDSQSATIPPQGMRRGEAVKLGDQADNGGASSGGAYYPPPSNQSRSGAAAGVRTTSLPEPVPSAPPASYPQPYSSPPPQRSASAAPRVVAAPPQAKPIAAGATIDVAAGDTLYGIARRHAVPVNELMAINNLTTPTIRPGQKLVLPASRSIAHAPTPQKPIKRAVPGQVAMTPAATAASGAATPISPMPVVPVPANWTGSHTVKSGESLYGIARANHVSFAQLQQVNGIADPTKVRPGTVLKVPSGSGTAASSAPSQPTSLLPAAGSKVAGASAVSEPSESTQVPTKPVIINSQPVEQKVAAVTPTETMTDATAAVDPPAKKTGEAATSGKFRWPVKGRVIASYGPRADQTHNDGINIAVPQGTEVLAAEGGVVAYAGSELKGYGNLILLRHDNGYVTAYAHNDEILVKRGDKVRRGQAIAKAGKTGTVDQPQVHFEIRQGQKPVDPMPHLEKL